MRSLNKYNFNFQFDSFFSRFCFFIFFRLISSIIVFVILYFYDSRIFSYTDLDFYGSQENSLFSPNFLYSNLVKIIGYNQNTILETKYIIISFFIGIIFTTPYIYISNKYLSKRKSLLYLLLLSFHPYLALYSLKFDTSIFGLLGVGGFTIYLFKPNKSNFSLSLLINSFTSLMRNSMLPFVFCNLMLLFKKKFKYSLINIVSIVISGFLISFVIYSQIGYGLDYLGQNYGCYSLGNIDLYLSNFVGSMFSSLLSIFITPIIHLILDLGAREAISIYCLNLPERYASSNLINISSSFLFLIFHSFLIFRMIRWINLSPSKNRLEFLIPFSILLPTLYGVAHMRYLLPLIPFMMLWIFMPFRREISNNY